ncbi:MAG: 3-deoxy-manno-octulosonate cytidylyltransferase [Planctomycetes bacterium]|nr:3-deoxy-manno-octulosonate cytidylyltransferase [Planctomycetota bacterium]
MKTLVVIPARYGSTRLPAKMLLRATGKYLIQHTYEQVTRAKLVDRVIIATDDRRVYQAARGFGAEVTMTSRHHTCGTERVAEVAANLNYPLVVNVQGDEPVIDPDAIDKTIKLLNSAGVDIATLACPLQKKELTDPSKVKVLLDKRNFALGFYRKSAESISVARHIGIYGYKRNALLELVKLPQTLSEKIVKLEQLRALENGFTIKVGMVGNASYGIDTPADYRAFVRRARPSGAK